MGCCTSRDDEDYSEFEKLSSVLQNKAKLDQLKIDAEAYFHSHSKDNLFPEENFSEAVKHLSNKHGFPEPTEILIDNIKTRENKKHPKLSLFDFLDTYEKILKAQNDARKEEIHKKASVTLDRPKTN